MQRRVCHYFTLVVYQPLCPALHKHFPTEPSGQFNEADATGQTRKQKLREVMGLAQDPRRCGQNANSSLWNSSPVIIHFFIQPLVYPAGMRENLPVLGPGPWTCDKMAPTLHGWNLYYVDQEHIMLAKEPSLWMCQAF